MIDSVNFFYNFLYRCFVIKSAIFKRKKMFLAYVIFVPKINSIFSPHYTVLSQTMHHFLEVRRSPISPTFMTCATKQLKPSTADDTLPVPPQTLSTSAHVTHLHLLLSRAVPGRVWHFSESKPRATWGALPRERLASLTR